MSGSRDSQFVATAEVPSNIALVKYWGKRDPELQWPANDSLSMTLSSSRSITSAQTVDHGPDILLREDSSGRSEAVDASDKALRHLAFLRRELGMSSGLHLKTRNTFPTGCGIASSASGLGALTLAACAAWTKSQTLSDLAAAGLSLERLAELSRLGSGSACRSFFGGYVLWAAGREPHSQSVLQVHDEHHWQLANLIVVVSATAKATSSSAGHLTAPTSPLYRPRLAGLAGRLRRVRAAIAARDLDALGIEIETEALDMHAVMMTGSPSLRYLLGDSCEVLAWIRQEREARGLPCYFTIDAGPNIHVLCPLAESTKVAARIQAAFPHLAIIQDRTGGGPLLKGSSAR